MSRAILLVSHGKLASVMKESVELITGEQKHLFSLPMDVQATLSSYSNEIEIVANKLLEQYEELVIMADIKGGTPCNAATLKLLKDSRVHLIAGFHLGLVIEACITPLSAQELVENTSNYVSYVNVSTNQ